MYSGLVLIRCARQPRSHGSHGSNGNYTGKHLRDSVEQRLSRSHVQLPCPAPPTAMDTKKQKNLYDIGSGIGWGGAGG